MVFKQMITLSAKGTNLSFCVTEKVLVVEIGYSVDNKL